MSFKEAWNILQEDSSYLRWKKENPHAILSYAFITIQKELSNDWQIGYYDEKADRMITFSIVDTKVVDKRVDEVFKEPGSKMFAIDMSKVKLGAAEILKKIDAFITKEYPNEIPSKKIIILQNLKDHGLIWNITIISLTMNSLNIKISAETGEIKAHKLVSLMDYKSKEPF
ncbi:MAG: hypothetical protein WC471_00265 [Candidatus Woesearchaeota archaeon]